MVPDVDYEVHRLLCQWYATHCRDLPWRQTKDPYRIWLSEIILQQTRVQQGLPYYLDFIEHYPSVEQLAAASLDEVLRHWQGLGYYSRARNLHKAACCVASEHQGHFPDTYQGLLSLPGVGPYTAAAIASFAYNLPCAVVDGNVYRVLSRLFDININILSPAAYEQFRALAESCMRPDDSAGFNQAVMEFGALQCTAQQPACHNCPLSDKCLALARGRVAERPVREQNLKRRERYLHYIFLYDDKGLWLHQRQGDDIWRGLWEFPLLEEAKLMNLEELVAAHSGLRAWLDGALLHAPRDFRHQLTHQSIVARFFPIKTQIDTLDGYIKVDFDDLDHYALSRLSLKFLEKFNF